MAWAAGWAKERGACAGCSRSAGHGPVSSSAAPQVHDARVAALCLHHGVHALWSADRDFGRYPELTVKNPLLAELP